MMILKFLKQRTNKILQTLKGRKSAAAPTHSKAWRFLSPLYTKSITLSNLSSELVE